MVELRRRVARTPPDLSPGAVPGYRLEMKRLRLWPAYLILGLLAVALAKIWLVGDVSDRQSRIVLPTLISVLLSGLLLFVWWVAFSRASRRARGVSVLAAVLVAGLVASLVRVRGVTGDWIPIVSFRWHTSSTPAPIPNVVAVAEPSLGPSPEPTVETAPVLAGSPVADVTPREPVAKAPPKPARRSGDFPQFLGPNRDGTVAGPRLARDWSTRPPRRLWRQAIGEGWSGFAVVGNIAVTQEQRGAEERVVAHDLLTGRLLWGHADAARYDTFTAGVGPRATPAIVDGRVFAMGATGTLNALDLADGRRAWTRKVVEENGGVLPDWGKSCSPLVSEGRVIVSAGGPNGRSLVAYDARSGEPVWAGGSDRASYSSPRLIDLAGRSQIVIFNASTLAGHDPATGALLWEQACPFKSPIVAAPVPLPGDRVLISAGYGIGAKVYTVAAGPDSSLQTRLEWESPRLKSKFANVVVHDGFVYGLDDGVLTCLDPATGERKWKGGRYGHGQLLLVDDVLLVQTEDGEVVMLDPSPEGQRELTRFAALDGKSWNPPALAGNLLVVRNDREAAVYELPSRE